MEGSALGGHRSARRIGPVAGPTIGTHSPHCPSPGPWQWVVGSGNSARRRSLPGRRGHKCGVWMSWRYARAAYNTRCAIVRDISWSTGVCSPGSFSSSSKMVLPQSTLASVRTGSLLGIEIFRCSASLPWVAADHVSVSVSSRRCREQRARSCHGAVDRETLSSMGSPVWRARNRSARSTVSAVGVASISVSRVRRRVRVREMASCRPRVCCRRMMSR